MKIIFVLGFLSFINTFYLQAQCVIISTSDDIKHCLSDDNSINQIACLKINFSVIDSSMNRYYELLLYSYKQKGRRNNLRKLKKSQLFWIKMRDKQCLSFYEMTPKEDQEIYKYICLIELTTNRENEICKFLDRFRM